MQSRTKKKQVDITKYMVYIIFVFAIAIFALWLGGMLSLIHILYSGCHCLYDRSEIHRWRHDLRCGKRIKIDCKK